MTRIFFVMASLSGAIGVIAGAFGAHALKARLSEEMLHTFEVGVRYQIYHALALFAVVLAMERWPRSPALHAGWCFVAGTILFSGSLYALVLTGMRGLGAITPLGGLSFIAGWLLLAWSAWQG